MRNRLPILPIQTCSIDQLCQHCNSAASIPCHTQLTFSCLCPIRRNREARCQSCASRYRHRHPMRAFSCLPFLLHLRSLGPHPTLLHRRCLAPYFVQCVLCRCFGGRSREGMSRQEVEDTLLLDVPSPRLQWLGPGTPGPAAEQGEGKKQKKEEKKNIPLEFVRSSFDTIVSMIWRATM